MYEYYDTCLYFRLGIVNKISTTTIITITVPAQKAKASDKKDHFLLTSV